MSTRSTLSGLTSVAVMVVALFLVACSTAQPSSPTSSALVADTKPYGSLIVASSFTGHLDPQISSSQAFEDIGAAIFDTLVGKKFDAQPGPGVAERWEISADGKTHTFYIRKGIKFHNGDDLTAADVKFSIERMMAPASIASDAGTWRGAVASVEVLNDYTVAIRMKTPQYLLLARIEGQSGAVFPKKYIEEKGDDYFRANMVGSGPWKVVSYIPGNKLEIEAVENHWQATPKFQKVTLLAVPDEATKVAMLKTGELDAAMVAVDSIGALKAAGIRVQGYDAGAQYFGKIFYDMDNPDKYAVGDVRVRKAMQQAINVKELSDGLFGGAAEPFAVTAISPFASFFDKNVVKPEPYNPEGAKKLLAEAGYPNGFSHTLIDILRGSELSNIDVAVQGYWRKVGIDTELLPMQYDVNRSMYNPKHNPKVWNTSFIMLSTESIEFEKASAHYHYARSSYHNIKIPTLDKLIDEIPATADPAKRKQMMLEATVLIKNDYSSLSILAPYVSVAIGPKIGKVEPFRASRLVSYQLATFTHAK